MAFNPNFGASIQAVFQDPGLYQQVAQKTYLPEALKSLWNMNATLQDAVQKNRIANEMEEENPDFDKIAAMDARRINNQDPTSIWRWKAAQDQAADLHGDTLFAQQQQREEDLKRIAAEKASNREDQVRQMQNKLDAYLPTMTIGLNTTPEQAQQFANTLAGLEAEASNYGIVDPRIAALKTQLSGELPYNAMMAAIDELEDIDANFGKGADYANMKDAKKFEVFQKKLEDARNNIIENNPDLWNLMAKDRRYNKKLMTLLSNRKPKSKGPKSPYEL